MSQTYEDTRSLPTFAVHTLIFAQITVMSLAGNSLVCVALYRNRRLRTITNIYVLSLAITDITSAALIFPFSTVASGIREWPFGFYFCQFSGFLSYIWALLSMDILALTAVNRYICVVKPRLYAILFTAKKTVFLILFMSLLTYSLYLAAILVSSVSYQWNPGHLFCQIEGEEIPASRPLVFTFVAEFFAFPLCVIIFCYGKVYRTIRQHNSAVIPSLQEANASRTVSAQEIQASRVLSAAVIAFCVCWIPSTIVVVLERLTPVAPFWQSFSTLASASSAWINPIIYGVMNRAMRKEFMTLLHCVKGN